MSKHHRIIKAPVITEKNTLLREENKYVFEVASQATKPEIKRAIEQLFEVSVESVNVSFIKRKTKRVGRYPQGMTARKKKAIVKLQEGQSIQQMDDV